MIRGVETFAGDNRPPSARCASSGAGALDLLLVHLVPEENTQSVADLLVFLATPLGAVLEELSEVLGRGRTASGRPPPERQSTL